MTNLLNPICYLENADGTSHTTGWICSPDGFIMGPGHLYLDGDGIIDHLDDIDAADRFTVINRGNTYSASLVFAYKNYNGWIDFALLKIDNSSETFDYFPAAFQCNRNAGIFMSGYGKSEEGRILTSASGKYISKIHHRDNYDQELLKVNCGDAVQYGFSGSPVYADDLHAVIGMQIRVAEFALDPNNLRLAEKSSIFTVSMEKVVQRFPFMRKILRMVGTGFSGCTFPQRLISDIRQGNCILFIGAGCSLDAGLPTWDKLIRDLLDYTYYSITTDETIKKELETLLKREKYLIVARYCRNKLGENLFRDFMKKSLTCSDYKNAEAHKILSDIKFKTIMTTNYDSLIEHFNKEYKVYIADDLTGPADFLTDDAPILLKIHGSLDKPGPIILTSTDFRKTIFGNNHFKENLKKIFKHSTVLFVGYSFEDPNISMLLQELLTDHESEAIMHYALMPNITSIMSDYLHDDMNVSVIPYTTRWDSFEPLHMALNDLVSCLPTDAFKSTVSTNK